MDALPRLADLLRAGHPNVRVVVAGDGPLRLALQREAEEPGVGKHLVWLGSVDHEDMPRIVRSFDVAVAPYPIPADHAFYFSPLKVFEYLACGVPTVAASIGQLHDLFGPDSGVLLYPPGDMFAAAEAVSSLLEDPDRRRRMGAAGAGTVAAQYTWERNVAAILSSIDCAP